MNKTGEEPDQRALRPIPESENPFKFAAKRLQEMTQLLNAMKNPNQTKLVFQTLPNHMRRRTATQNPKRLPKRMRAAHISQMKKSGVPIKKKRPSRKYRRKPGNLKQEYKRRSMKDKWLETHVWHAKRFHMARKWGYKVPFSPCDKSYRACYRATAKHCLLQDVSFLQTIQIEGPISVLKERFSRICSQNCGLTITAKSFLSGKREGHCNLFKIDQFPFDCFGEVSFIWNKNISEGNSSVWITAHAAFYQDLLEEFVLLFELSKDENSFNNQTLEVSLKEINYINRFRLTGPLSNTILSKSLVVKDPQESDNWLKEYSSNPIQNGFHSNQKQFFDQISKVISPSELPPNLVLGLNIEDPRLSRPNKRTKAVPDYSSEYETILEIPDNLNQSAIFEMDLIKEISSQILPTGQFCKLRSEKCIIPGEKCSFEKDLQACPILLIQRPGNKNSKFSPLGFNSGWDIIVPFGYGMITWLCLIMWGARAGGVREQQNTLRECGIDQFLPDTNAGKRENSQKNLELRELYFKRPYNKRPNFTKLSICSPFQCQWGQLLSEWGEIDITNYFVIRDRSILESLKTAWKKRSLPALDHNLKNALIPIYVAMETRGNPGNRSLICLPEKVDFLNKKSNKGNRFKGPIYIEPQAKDPKEALRKSTRQKHLKLLLKIRRQRVKIKRKLQLTSTQKVRIEKSNNQQIILDQYKKMCEYWLPTTYKSIRNQCSRQTIGFLTQCDFSFTDSKVSAIGYITYNGFIELVKICRQFNNSFTLIRGTKTRNYRCGIMEINPQ